MLRLTVAPITLTALCRCLGVLALVGGGRTADVGLLAELTLLIATGVALVALGGFDDLSFGHVTTPFGFGIAETSECSPPLVTNVRPSDCSRARGALAAPLGLGMMQPTIPGRLCSQHTPLRGHPEVAVANLGPLCVRQALHLVSPGETFLEGERWRPHAAITSAPSGGFIKFFQAQANEEGTFLRSDPMLDSQHRNSKS